jgi:hypothetical protein
MDDSDGKLLFIFAAGVALSALGAGMSWRATEPRFAR